MNPDLKNTAAKLLQDINIICTAFDACDNASQQVQQRYPDDHIQIRSSIDLATWAHYHFDGDWQKFIAFTCEALDAWPRDKSQMWMLDSPAECEPEPEAARHLDRIDVALHFITQKLGMTLPFKTVRDHGWHQRNHLLRVQAFVGSLNDVLLSPDV